MPSEMLLICSLIVFAKQSPALRDAPQAMDFAQRGATRRGINPHSPAASSNKPAATSRGKDSWPNQAEIKEQKGGDDQDRFAQPVRAIQSVFFRRFPTDLPQSTCSLSSPRMEARWPKRVPGVALRFGDSRSGYDR